MKLKEIKLNTKDYYYIKDQAVKIYVDYAVIDGYTHHVKSIVQAFIDYTIANKLVVKDGKVYKNEEESTKTV